MSDDGPSFETLEEEMDLVLARHNELFSMDAALTVSQLFQLVDHYRLKHNVEIDEIRDEGDGLFMMIMQDGTRAAALGVDGPENLERATSMAEMLPREVARKPVSGGPNT